MSEHYDAIVVGAGHNGLVAAAYLAAAGKKVLVLESRNTPGGLASVWSEGVISGGSACAEFTATLNPRVVSDLGLNQRGLQYVPIDPAVRVLDAEREPLTIYRDEAATLDSIARHSPRDAQRYPEFARQIETLAGVLAPALAKPCPQPEIEGGRDVFELLRLGLSVRQLGSRLTHEMLRVIALSAADYLHEWFEGELLQAAMGASAIQGSVHGPRSVGTAALMLYRHASPTSRPLGYRHAVRGGIARVGELLAEAAQGAGAEIRLQSKVSRIETDGVGVEAVVLEDGTSFRTDVVVSNVSPRSTLLELMDPFDLEPEFLNDLRNIRYRGCSVIVNAVVDRLPSFDGVTSDEPLGILQIGSTLDHLERASDATKYGRASSDPFLLVSVPSQLDPTRAAAGSHLVNIQMQYAPYALREGSWSDMESEIRESVVASIDRHAPGFRDSVRECDVITPRAYEDVLGCPEGQWDQGEMTLDQILFMRPVPGWARHNMPISGLFLCGAATHPGSGLLGACGLNAAQRVLRISDH